MKLVKLGMIACAVLIGTSSLARDNDRLVRGSQAWLVQESAEFALRSLPTAEIKSLSVELTSAEDADVLLIKQDGTEVAFSCFMFDEWSRGGTVLKKEVACR